MDVLCRKTTVNIQMNEAQGFAPKMLNRWEPKMGQKKTKGQGPGRRENR